jgi:hypothetical protein
VRRGTRKRILQLGIVLAAAVVAVLLLLIAFGYLVLPSSPPNQFRVTGVHWTILEGTTPGGLAWFGPSQFNYSGADGYPVEVSVGKTVTIPWSFSSYDTVNHTIYSVVASSPFTVVNCDPSLPAIVPSGTDDALLTVTVQVPGAGGSGELNLTVAAR